VAPVVQASSSSLAFTGPGAATGWIVVAGAALIVLGLAMLVLADAPRRLRWALARHARYQEALWVGDAGYPGGPEHQR
jgi:hypothetical protein